MFKWLKEKFGKKQAESAANETAVEPAEEMPVVLHEEEPVKLTKEEILQKVEDFVAQNYYEIPKGGEVRFSMKSGPTRLTSKQKWFIEQQQKQLVNQQKRKRLGIVGNVLDWVEEDYEMPTFSSEVKRIMDEKQLTSSDICERVLMDRKLFSKMNTNPDYRPSKETAVTFCLALQLTRDEAEDLLDWAGYSLSCSIKYDTIIIWLLKNQIYDLDTINEVLDKFDEKCIGVKE